MFDRGRKAEMKKTSGQIFGTILFLLIGLSIFTYISNIFRAKTISSIDMVHSLYQEERDTIDVLVLGSSHGYSSIQPNLLWHEYGITTFCMCSPGQLVPSSYYLLQEALKYQKPKIVLFESYYMRTNLRHNANWRLRKAIDGVRMSKLKMQALEDILPSADEMGMKERLPYYIPFLLYHSRWNDLRDYDFHASSAYLKGSIYNRKVFPMDDPGVPDVTRKIPKVSLSYFEKIRQICEKNGIQLVVFAAPFGCSEKRKSAYEKCVGVNNTLETYLSEENIPFLYYQKIPEAGIDFSTDFRSRGHMNTNGAEKLSRHLGAYLSQQFDLEDHRQDPAYGSWDADYEKYLHTEMDISDNG